MPKVKHGNFEYDSEKDADLQQDQLRTPKEVERNWNLYWKQALGIIFTKVKKFSDGKIILDPENFASDFIATQRAPLSSAIPKTAENLTGWVPNSFVPVEWKLRQSSGQGSSLTYWQLMIDIDDIPPGASGAGPDRPHIGYLLTSKGKESKRIDGHIFIDHVIASRNSLGCEETVAAKPLRKPLGGE